MMRRDIGKRNSLDDPLAALQQQQDENLSDDDNAAPDIQSEVDLEAEKEDPLLLAIDDLEGRVVSALDDIKLHPGVRTSSAPGSPSMHEELATVLRPVLEVAAHTGPSVARTYYPVVAGGEGVEASCEDVYRRVVSDLVLPVMLEMAQSDTIPAKRAASLEFFHNFWKECHKAGSWLDKTTTGPNAGPYGSGGSSIAANVTTPGMRNQQKRRHAKKMEREAEILRYWVQGSIACTLPGAFTSEASEGAVASRGIIAASASLRPSLKHIAERIQDADDRGAARLYGPVMKMVEGVLTKMFLSMEADTLRSACIKFVEIVILCCSSKAQLTTTGSAARRRSQNVEDFSLEDLPAGHPVITREALETIAEYAFATLRGMIIMGGQVKIDVNLLSDMMLGGHGDASPSSHIVSILKPAALAFLEIESSVQQDNDSEAEFKIDRSNFDMDFTLDQKSFTVAINAVSMMAINRPVFYKEAATCLARRTYDPPAFIEGGSLTNSAVLAIAAQLRASCLTLLRNTLSVITNKWDILHQALVNYDMGVQADKAVAAARQAAALTTAGRAARNRAAMFYEWDDSEGDKRVSKRQRETDDALAKMRAAKASRGLGHGIKLPSSMVDSVELILLNLPHLPLSRPPPSKSTKGRKIPVSLDFVVDAVMSNGASLSQDDGQWYDRDGGAAWSIDMENEPHYAIESTILLAAEVEHDENKAMELDEKSKGLSKLFNAQCHSAASDAFGRIVTNSSRARTAYHNEFANKVAARLAWTLKGVPPPKDLQSSIELAEESVKSLSKHVDALHGASDAFKDFVTSFPLVSSCLTLDVTASINPTSMASAVAPSSMSSFVLNEAYMHDCSADETQQYKHDAVYDRSLDVYAASVAHASERANEKPSDLERKRVASLAAATLPQHLGVLPSVTPSSLALISALCDIEEITKKDAEAARKSSQQTIAASASVHAAKVAAEKRATAALLALRDTAFQRSKPESRKSAVDCAVAVAAGRYPSTPSVEDKALKLVMNVLFPRSEGLSNTVVESASGELRRAADFAIANYEAIQRANKDTPIKADAHKKHGSVAGSEEEQKALDHVRKPTMVFMALCVRRPDLIKTLMTFSCKKKADVLLRTVQANMPKLARAAATKHGAATVALKVSEMANDSEVPVVLAFLDNIVPVGDKNLPPRDLIDACFAIQELRLGPDGKKDARFIIPVVTGMKRAELIDQLPAFVAADNKILLAALEKMGSRVARQALLFRDEPDPESSSLHGMTLCEQLVFLHQMDFSTVGLPQKRYLDVIRLCLEDDEVFTDRVVMAALDYMSGRFLTTEEKLPLAYMRTIILTCSKHESLHSWICHVLLPRLIEGKVYTDRRQWEGWMRCAKMLENTGDSGVSSLEAISKLPSEQLEMYRAKYPQ